MIEITMMRGLVIILACTLLCASVIGYLKEREEKSFKNFTERCERTDMFVLRYKGGWTPVYDCSNREAPVNE